MHTGSLWLYTTGAASLVVFRILLCRLHCLSQFEGSVEGEVFLCEQSSLRGVVVHAADETISKHLCQRFSVAAMLGLLSKSFHVGANGLSLLAVPCIKLPALHNLGRSRFVVVLHEFHEISVAGRVDGFSCR